MYFFERLGSVGIKDIRSSEALFILINVGVFQYYL
jgi:hypothetical protein